MAMSLQQFRASVKVLPEPEGSAVRERFVEAFVGSTADGAPMWAGIRGRQRVSLARLWATVASTDVAIVLWDPPAEGVLRRRAGAAFGARDVLECRVVDLELGVEWLPDDLYVFDRSYSWSAIFTHETDVDGGVLLLAGAALPRVG